MRWLAASAALGAAGALAGAPAAAARNPLTAAGFVARPADTPARAAMLLRLPPLAFVAHHHGRATAYAFADPGACHCLYLGGADALRRYARRTGTAPRPVAGRDLLWDWDAWRPIGPFFRWGPGLGF